MAETKIPGVKTKHAIITPVCRDHRGSLGAIVEALRIVEKEYGSILGHDTQEQRPTFHLVLTVEWPKVGAAAEKAEEL